MPAIHNLVDFLSLPKVKSLKKGDILIKKIFDSGHGIVANAIVGLQGLSQNKNLAMQQGSKSSEHVAIALDPFLIAEAVGPGIVVNSLSGEDRPDTEYIVYRCNNNLIGEAAANLAEGMGRNLARIHQASGSRQTGGQYHLLGAAASLFRDPRLSGRANDLLNAMINYYLGLTNHRPRAFCSMFVCACYEAVIRGSFLETAPEYRQYALEVDPYGISPMEYEGHLARRPAGYQLAGWYIESSGKNSRVIQNKIFQDICDAVLQYELSTKGLFRKLSAESLNALNQLNRQISLCRQEADRARLNYRIDQLYVMTMYYMQLLDTMPQGAFDPAARAELRQICGAPLKPDSTFMKYLKKHLNLTTIHWV